MKLRCLAVDDEPMALDKLKSYIERVPYLELVGACEGSYEAMQFLENSSVDAMFIDINMPDTNGLEFVRALSHPPMVVFTTAYAEYAVESYKVRAVDYLLKPFGFTDFQRAAENLRDQYNAQKRETSDFRQEDGFIYLKVDYRYVRVAIDDIVYVEGMNEYLKVHKVTGAPLLTHMTFKQMLEYLPDSFLQVHRSYVVNMKHVQEVERSVATMTGGQRISVSDSNKDAFMAYLQKYLVRK